MRPQAYSFHHLLCVLLAALLLPACDALDEAVDNAVEPIEISLGDAGRLPIVDVGQPLVSPQVEREGLNRNFPNAVEVEGIELEGVSFDPAEEAGEGADTGTVRLYFLLSDVPLFGTTITVSEDGTEYSPNPIPLGANSGFATCAADYEAGEGPDLELRDDYDSVDVQDYFFDEILGDTFGLQALACVDGGLVGELTIETLFIDLGSNL